MVTLRVVRHAKDDLVGVDDESGERFPLGFDEVRLFAPDWPAIRAALRAGLGLSGTEREVPEAVDTWEVGRIALTDHLTAPILLCATPHHLLGPACDRILAEGLRDGVVLVGNSAVVPGEVMARLRERNLVIVGLCDAIALDARRRLVGLAGPESIVGDLRARLGLAPVDQPAYQFIRTGKRWDIVFNEAHLSIDDQKGLHYISLLLDKPGSAIDVQTLVATVADVERHLLQGSKGVVNDRQSRDSYMAEYRRLQQLIDDGHSDSDRLMVDQERIMDALGAGDGLGGEDRQLTDAAQMGRGVGTAIDRAIKAIGVQPNGGELVAHLKESLKSRTGQNPSYRPATAIVWTTAR